MKTRCDIQKVLILMCFLLLSGGLSAFGGLQFSHNDALNLNKQEGVGTEQRDHKELPKPAQDMEALLTALSEQEDPKERQQLLQAFQKKTIMHAIKPSVESDSNTQSLFLFDILRLNMAIESLNLGPEVTADDYLARNELIRQIAHIEDPTAREGLFKRLEEREQRAESR